VTVAGTIVLGFDDSAGSRRALEVALELARGLGDELVVAFGAQPPGRGVGDEQRAHAAALEEMGRELCAQALERAKEAGVAAEAAVAPERPVDLLLALAEQREARLIVVGSYGESPLRGAVLGSVPHKLLHLSAVPVLAVPAPAD
jgi:nucleotide-binding universal stress UspA family protein